MRVLVLFFLLLFAACQAAPPAEFTDAQKAQIEAEVEQIVREQMDAANQANIEPIVSRAASEIGICVWQATIYRCQEVLDSYQEAWTSDEDPRLERQEADDVEIRALALSPTVVVVGNTIQENRAYRTDGTVNRARFAHLQVWVLEDGEWKWHSSQQAAWPIEDDVETEQQ